jgi:thiol-disulfide isomerase/thioredoxin
MKQIITFMIILAIVVGCTSRSEPFEYTIRGTVIGQDSGQFYMDESIRAGDELAIPFKNHQFEYKGTSPNMFKSSIRLEDYAGGSYSFIVEPGDIIFELHTDSLAKKSKVQAGYYNLTFQKATKERATLWAENNYTKERLIALIKDNSKNYGGVYYLLGRERSQDYLPVDELGEILVGVEDKGLKRSREYIKLNSMWLSKKDSINMVGTKAMDFDLLNVNKEVVNFQSVAKDKITYVEKSGSWCGNSTRLSRELKPIYEKYKEKGFEIVTVVPELKLDRWEKWIEKEKFPWINLVELEDDIAKSGISVADMLFRGYGFANYLVDANGDVIATNISSVVLNEMLMQEFDPVSYREYIKNKWSLPEEISILDREEAINSFDELVQQLPGKPFLIDCWVTWHEPCIDDFRFNEHLHTILKSKDMEMVYIYFEESIEETAWLDAIRKYDLKGYHLRINESFRNDLSRLDLNAGLPLYMIFESGGGLPLYMIVDSGGEVVVKDAFRPSEKEKLYHQIENAIVKNVL